MEEEEEFCIRGGRGRRDGGIGVRRSKLFNFKSTVVSRNCVSADRTTVPEEEEEEEEEEDQLLTLIGDLLGDEILEDLEPTLLLRGDAVAEGLLGAPEDFFRQESLRRRILDVKSRPDQKLLVRVAWASLGFGWR